jgi:hypothetical protein
LLNISRSWCGASCGLFKSVLNPSEKLASDNGSTFSILMQTYLKCISFLAIRIPSNYMLIFSHIDSDLVSGRKQLPLAPQPRVTMPGQSLATCGHFPYQMAKQIRSKRRVDLLLDAVLTKRKRLTSWAI